jgi:hypothetical protein
MLVISSCLKYQPMTLEKRAYWGTIFLTDGYYFRGRTISNSDTSKSDVTTTLVFFRNGMLLTKSFVDVELDSIDIELSSMQSSRDFLEGVGFYQVSENKIVMEYWANASYFPIPTATATALILNDSTLKSDILGHYENDIWKFRPLAVKPDSTTLFDEQLEKGEPIRRTRSGQAVSDRMEP